MSNRAAVLKATAIAAIVAAILLVSVVLPAEYGIDPLGTGKLLGLDTLTGQQEQAVEPQSGQLHKDEVTFVLGTYESVEYKYATDADAALVFEWRATVPVTFDFHGEPEDGPEGFAESYTAGKSDGERGAFHAPFAGIHGWYFENRSFSEVQVTLQTSGFYTRSLTFRDGFVTERDFD